MTASHMSRLMRLHRAVTSDARVVDQDLDRSVLVLDPLDRSLARGEVARIELDGRDAGLLLEGLGRRVVAGVARRPPFGQPLSAPC